MILILTASKDTYITNKIIDNDYRAKDANVGRAGTIDLFKLYEESTFLSGSTKITGSVRESSRALIKFNLDTAQSLTASSLDLNSSNFKATIKMFDILGGQATPSNFNLVAYPLSMSFDEGYGRDVSAFGDLDTANYVTASITNNTVTAWNSEGASSAGLLNSTNIDYITSGTIAGTTIDFGGSQHFKDGNEDLEIDVTKFVSSSLAGNITNYGFRIFFSGSDATDDKTRFVKRFASRHSSNTLKTPQLVLKWSDSITDHHKDFVFNESGSIFLRNYVRGVPSNFVSGTAATEIKGSECMHLKLQVQDYTLNFSASQHTAGTDSTGIAGLYSASFSVSEFENSNVNDSKEKIKDLILKSGSVTFNTYWLSDDQNVAFHTGSLEVKPSRVTSFARQPSDILFRFINLETEYNSEDDVFLSVFAEDFSQEEKVYKIPRDKESIALSNIFYRVREVATNTVVIPFDTENESTKLSSDSNGMNFFFKMVNLPKGKIYCFDLLVKDYAENRIYKEASGRFKVV